MKQIRCAIVILMIYSISLSEARPIDTSTAWWLLIDVQGQTDLSPIIDAIQKRGNIPPNQIRHRVGRDCSNNQIRSTIFEMARSMGNSDRLIVYFRGFITKPKNENSVYFLIHDDKIQDRTLNRWLEKAKSDRTILIIDSQTSDLNLEAFYANRQPISSTSLISIQQNDKWSIARHLPKLITDELADTDDDRKLALIEINNYLLEHAADGLLGIFVPTGQTDEIIVKLPTILKITSDPTNAQILRDGEVIGETPFRTADPDRVFGGKLEIAKTGFLKHKNPILINAVFDQGEVNQISVDLKPIPIFGKIEINSDEEIDLKIRNSEFQQNVREKFRINDWRKFGLEIGKNYFLEAETPSLFYATAEFTLDGSDPIERNLTLTQKTWFEMTEIAFDLKELEKTVAAFQNGIELETDFPIFSDDLHKLLFDSFSTFIAQNNNRDLNYLIVTAKLADRLENVEASKKFWVIVQQISKKASAERKLADRRLRQLNFKRFIFNIFVVIGLIIAVASGVYQLVRRSKGGVQNVQNSE